MAKEQLLLVHWNKVGSFFNAVYMLCICNLLFQKSILLLAVFDDLVVVDFISLTTTIESNPQIITEQTIDKGNGC